MSKTNPDNNANQETNKPSNADPNNNDNHASEEDGATQAEHEAPGVETDNQTEIVMRDNTQST
eukprot:11042250-Ditylum_brightwellii.AAC.2